MNVSRQLREAIEQIVDKRFDNEREIYNERINNKRIATEKIKERAREAYAAVMNELYDSVLDSSNWCMPYYRGSEEYKNEFNTTEENKALHNIDVKSKDASNNICLKLMLMGTKVDVEEIIENYFIDNQIN